MLKKNRRNLIMSLMISVLLLLGPVSVLADEMGHPADSHQATHHGEDHMAEMRHEGMQVLLSTNMFQMMVDAGQGYPFYHFNTTMEDAMFFLMFQNMTQYRDLNGNGMFENNESIEGNVSSLDLSQVTWEIVILNDSSQMKEFAFRSKQIQVPGFENTSIEIINHFNGSTSIKFDVKVSSWPFIEGATSLSLDFMLHWGRMAGSGSMHGTGTQGSMMPNSVIGDNGALLTNLLGSPMTALSQLEPTHGDDHQGNHGNDGNMNNGSMNHGEGNDNGTMSMNHHNMSEMMPHEEMMTPLTIISNDSGIFLQDEGTTLAYFKITTDVIIDGELVTDGAVLQLESNGSVASMVSARINYPKFNQTLFHDPEFGTSEQALVFPASDLTTILSFFSSLGDVKQGFILLTGLLSVFLLVTYAFFSRRNQQ